MQLVTYEDSEFDKKYAELDLYRAVIPPDPIALGFSGIASLMSEMQGKKDRVTELLNKAALMRTKAKIQLDSTKYVYETQLDVLLESDGDVLIMPSDRTRLARANRKLRDKIDAMKNAELVYKLIDVYYKTVSNVYNNLESANRNLTEQCNIFKRMNPPAPYPPSNQPGTRIITEV